MADKKFCDIHPNEKNETPIESIRAVTVTEWKKIDGKNVPFENKLDVCLSCLAEFVKRAKGLNVPYENNWKTEVLQKGKSGKWFKQRLSPDEFEQYRKEQALAEEKRELMEMRASMGK